MVSYHSARFGGHRRYDSRDRCFIGVRARFHMLWHKSAITVVSEAYDGLFSHTRNFTKKRTYTKTFAIASNEIIPILVTPS